MYAPRPTTHLSPILSGDGTEYCSSESSSSSTPACAPPPPSAAVSSSNSLDDLNCENISDKVIEMPKWRRIRGRTQEHVPAKVRKLSALDQYATIEKSKRIVRFQEENNGYSSTTALDSACAESESSFWSEGGASFGFSKYTHSSPRRPFLQPPPPSPNWKSNQNLNFPRTNPFATSPRQVSSLTRGFNLWPLSESSTSTTATSSSDTDSVWINRDYPLRQAGRSILHSSVANAERRRILAGLKTFGIKGELLVSILLNRGLLTVTIEEGRNLVPPCGSGFCSAYVRLSLMPDEEKRTQCKTELIPHTNRPVFHQTFTVELLPEDYEKRLVISMWNRENANDKSVLLGCMAFTVRHMVESNKVTDGWYFLLSPQYGRRKHLAVHKVNMITYYGAIDTDQEGQSSR